LTRNSGVGKLYYATIKKKFPGNIAERLAQSCESSFPKYHIWLCLRVFQPC